ncbi:hypothetical protein [uncultured Martelella sp.]|uniref:hypothetical protein n=1 Tax=uncultured Martelella sp. TaxID=392331 RepID=UPI0029C73E31|nr:hypothetical protein [uncultured Martelella sp.]
MHLILFSDAIDADRLCKNSETTCLPANPAIPFSVTLGLDPRVYPRFGVTTFNDKLLHKYNILNKVNFIHTARQLDPRVKLEDDAHKNEKLALSPNCSD